MYATNAQNHVVVNLRRRLLRWIVWKIQKKLTFLENSAIWRLAKHILGCLVENKSFNLPNLESLSGLTPSRLFFVDLRCQYVFRKAKNIILEKKLLGDDIVRAAWWDYLRPLCRILKTFEKNSQIDAQSRRSTGRRGRGLRLFSLLPLTSYHQRFILIDSDALLQLFNQAGWVNMVDAQKKEDFYENITAWWMFAFRIEKVITANRRFGFSVSTDGMNVSVNVRRKAQAWDGVNSHGFNQEGVYIPLNIADARVVGLDPGRRDLFRTAYGESNGEGESCSLKEWREISGITRAAKKRETWLKNSMNIQQVIRGRLSIIFIVYGILIFDLKLFHLI
jgi:hypothetical protein